MGLTALIGVLSTTVHQSNLGNIIGVFADLALLTSFLGVSLGLFEFMGDSLRNQQGKMNRPLASVVTFLPPLILRCSTARLHYGAGLCRDCARHSGHLLPLVMVIKCANKPPSNTIKLQGQRALLVTGLVGLLIIGAQLLITLGILPALG